MANRNILFVALISTASILCRVPVNGEFANQWAVYMHGGMKVATQVALEHGFRNMGPVGMLKDVYLFTHRAVPRRQRRSALLRNFVLEKDNRVDLVVQQEVKRRVKREANNFDFSDQRWKDQWYLHNRDPGMPGHDMNILPVWKKGITGKNVVVTILDDGIEYTHRELRKNYDKNASYDYNDNDADPRPRWTLESSRHGTRCAGQIAAAANNSFCIVGVAYDSKIGGIRMLDGEVTDIVEARSLTHRRDYVDIYSSSWGPEDDGITVDGPGNLTKQALKEGILYGRKGKGSIFVWASGNGGKNDDCNCDGYTNSIYTVSAGASTSYGSRPWYLEECASTLISSYGGGNNNLDKRIITADVNGGCTSRHTGTSVAAPFVAGFIALALEANPNLTWRDVQHVLVNSANIRNLEQDNIQTNGADKKFSPTFGFGLLDGGALVDLAAKWSTVSEQHICKTSYASPALMIDSRKKLTVEIETKACKGSRNFVRHLEHTQLVVNLAHSSRGAISIYLVSPMGTRSRLLSRRKLDTRTGSFKHWAFLSVHFWGENPYGKWKLEIDSATGTGRLEQGQLIMYGTEFMPGVPYPNVDDQPFVPGQKGVRCHTECLGGCTGPEPYQCVSCKNYMIVDGNKTCVPICPAKYFTDEISLLCLPCHNACWSCLGPLSNQCTSCQPGEHLLKSHCLQQCPSYHFKAQHEVGFQCIKCHGNCLTCSGSAENCTTCRHEDILSDHHCIPRCDHGYFFDGLNCIPCYGSCHTCNGLGYRNCTSCRYRGLHGNYDFKTMYFYKGSCLFTCPPHYYGDHTKGVCEPCGKNCLRCVSEGEQCVACNWGYFLPALNKKDCIKECPRGQYPDLLNGLCILCSKECDSCIPGKPFECLSCKSSILDPRILKQSSCVSDCDIGFFSNATSKTCNVCPYQCSDCKGDKNCENCYVNLNEERCLDKCPTGTFRDKERRFRCTRCHPTCRECSGESPYQCLECPRGMILRSDRSCSLTCPPGAFYKDIKEQICKPCHPACTQCFGPSENECRRCVGHLQLRGTTCVQPCIDNLTENSCNNCHPKCDSCFGATETECLSCHRNKTLYEYHCTNRCPRGYYKVPGKSCMPCHKSCATCHGNLSTHCESCPTDLGLFEHQCLLRCPKGYFKLDEWCLKCAEKCEECEFYEDFCMRCKEGYVRREVSCHDSCGQGSFEVAGTRQCEKCHRNCKSCFGFNANQCLSCHRGMILYKSMCYEECPARYIAEAPTSICNSCTENCITCFSEGNLSVCENCRYPYVIHNGQCIKACPLLGYYTDFYTKSCKRCHETCDICYGPDKDECMLCKKRFSQIGSLCLEETCSQGYFIDAETLKCRKCHSLCRSCRGPSDRQCLACYGDYILHRNTCILGCSDGKFPDEKTGVCRFCSPSCKTCSGSASNTCMSCFEGHSLVNGKCRLQCAHGKYLDEKSGQCMPCHKRCNTCNGPEYNNCTACAKYRTLVTGTCLKSCAPGYFMEPISGICEPCNNVCGSCDGPTISNCTSCQIDHVLVAGTCILDCKEGSFFDFSSGKCMYCKSPCKLCIGPSSKDCITCEKGFSLVNGLCMLDCAKGSYLDVKLQKCIHCNDHCRTCDGAFGDNCTSCRKDFHLIDGKCILDCPEGKYADEKLGKCRHCDVLCKTCHGALSTDCSTCKSSYTLLEGKCILFCNQGYYPDEQIGTCLPCSSSCTACTGPTKKDCLSCNPGFIMKKGECNLGCNEDCFYNEVSESCEKCINPCASCYGPNINECLSCRANYNLIDTTCFPTCKQSEYLDGISWQCRECDDSCENCFGASRENCTLCKPGFTLIESTCYMICEGGKYRDYTSGKCLNCSDGCLACQGPTIADCVVCNKGFEYDDTYGCVAVKCVKGSYFDDDSWKCKPCSNLCESCDGPTIKDCLSCKEGRNLVNRTCVNKCSGQEFYDSSSDQCLKCNRLCKTCHGPAEANCTSCFKAYVLISNSCKNTCVIGSYLNEKRQECELCNDNCLTCDGPSKIDCTSCPPEYILKNGTCVVECDEESYYDLEERKCLPCSSRCLSCNGPTRKNCTGCFGSFVLRNGSCIQLCNVGSYRNIELDYCMVCDSSCKTCIGPETSDCTSCRSDKRLLDGKCVSKCAADSFFDQKTSQCKKCHLTCSECSGPNDNDCTRCEERFLLTNNMCHLWCLTGTYPDMTLLECVQCNASCKECTGPTKNDCSECRQGRRLVEGACEIMCQRGFYKVDDSCERCNSRCSECTGPNIDNCLSCNDGYRLLGSTCVEDCPIGYIDAEGKCKDCHKICLRCDGPGPNDCSKCKDDASLTESGSCSCMSGFFMQTNFQDCLECNSACEECKGPGEQNCTTCKNSLYFDHSKKKCSYVCSTGTYVVEDACYPCHETCHSCDGRKAEDCLLCNNSLVLYNATCINECPAGYYELRFDNKSICMACNDQCQNCSGERPNQCTSCHNESVLQEGSCRENCSAPYIFDVAGKECVIPAEKPFARKLLAFKERADQQRLSLNMMSFVSSDVLLLFSVSCLFLFFAFTLRNR